MEIDLQCFKLLITLSLIRFLSFSFFVGYTRKLRHSIRIPLNDQL